MPTFALHLQDLVRWVSGLNQQFAKLPYGLPYRGFESPPHRTLTAEVDEKKAVELVRTAFFSSTSAKPAARRAGMCDRREQIPQVRGGCWLQPAPVYPTKPPRGGGLVASLRSPPLTSPSTTAANPAIRCRCGIPRLGAPRPVPQRQQNPRFGAVAESPSRVHLVHRPSEAGWPFRPVPQRQQTPRFSAVAESPSCSILFHCPAGDIVFNEKELFARGGVRTK